MIHPKANSQSASLIFFWGAAQSKGNAILKTFAWALITSILITVLPCLAASDKPVNFIFLVDVSGSMVSRSTMVTDDKGSSITLFEALRQAVKNIVKDERLIGRGSRISFITFGTDVNEKVDWPTSVDTAEDRAKLVQLIGDPTVLFADRKGDTYMGGALNQALAKANDFLLKSDPCTTTFILMLTDGWDEPPANAQYRVSEVAQKIVQRKEMIKRKVGIATWQTAVVGLKRLPTSKTGTITAAEVSKLIDGTFLDVTKERGKGVSEQIYSALSKILENQRGTFVLAGDKAEPFFPMIDFGTVNGDGIASGSFDLEMLACDQEQISGIHEASRQMPADSWKKDIDKAALRHKSTSIRSVAELPAGAIKVTSEQSSYNVSPAVDEEGRRTTVRQTIKLTAQAGSDCPVGTFVGRIKLSSSARIPDSIPYVLSSPSRLATREELVKASVKRKGALTKEDTETTLTVSFVQTEGSPRGVRYAIEARVPSAKFGKSGSEILEAKCFNDGKVVSLNFDPDKQKSADAVIKVLLPADKPAGTYRGVLQLKVKGPDEMLAPKEIPFEVTLVPTDWERISPLAIPMILLLVAGLSLYVFLYFVSQNRK